MAERYVCHIVICGCCMLMHANGECCADEHGSDEYPIPLIKIGPNESIALDSDDEGFFSWSPCGGCGSRLGGGRYDVTLWERVSEEETSVS